MAASAFGTGVDLSMIPLSAVDHVDVLTDGSSAVYGSDAVGGVINVILRKDFNGEEARVRLDTLSRGGGEVKQLGQSVGRTWGSGGALLVFQFEDDNPIRSDQRSFTANLAKPTDVLPIAKRYSAVLTSHQDLAPSFELFADGLFEHDGGKRSLAFTSTESQATDNSTDSGSVNLGFRWRAFGDWHLEGSGLFSRVNTLTRGDFTPPQPPYVNGDPYIRAIDTVKEIDLKLDGTVWSNGSSSLKAAVGGSTREEQFAANTYYASGGPSDSRHATAAFAELYAPLITAANALPFVRKLELSAAVRDDSYSDFGSRTDPRFGLFFAPIDQLGLRVAYSTSFRAPNPFELLQASSVNTIYIESGFAQPNDPTGATPVLFVGNRVLKPETSRNLTVGLEFAPDTLPNTHFSLNYYHIVYSNRIIAPPIVANIFLSPQVYGSLIRQFPDDAAVAAYIAGIQPPEPVFDLSPGQTGLAGIRYGYTYGVINAAREKTEGLDAGARSVIDLGGASKLNLDFNATYLRNLQTTFCDTCTSTDLANTYGEPLKLRLRSSGGWSNGIVSTNAAVNFINGYSDTNVIPDGHIRSSTTLDLNAGLTLRSTGTYFGVNILNALNSSPPSTSPAFLNVAYDPSNADPRGRTLSFQVRQTW
jgi:iron complex outermembrane receptor protein